MAGSNHNDEGQWERPFAPADLDVLEDALELPVGREPAWPEAMDAGMRAQIGDALRSYGAIGVHARRVLLAAEPPKHVLDAVIAQARAAVVHPVMPDAPVVAPPRRWWSRPIAWVVPSLGAAVAAIAVFVVLQPREEAATVASAPATDDAAKAEAKPATQPGLIAMRDDEVADGDAGRGAGLVTPTTADGVREAEAGEAPMDRRTRDVAGARTQVAAEQKAKEEDDFAAPGLGSGAGRGAANDSPPLAKKKPANAPGASGAGGSSPPAEPVRPAEPRPDPASPSKSAPKPKAPSAVPTPDEVQSDDKKDSPLTLDDRLAAADDARRRGDCTSARRDYDAIIAAGSSRLRARARAGKALCLERAGQTDEARELLERARIDDPSIDAWVDAQR